MRVLMVNTPQSPKLRGGTRNLFAFSVFLAQNVPLLSVGTQFSVGQPKLDCEANMSAPTTTNPVSSSPKRSWRRFTLRALFLAVLAAAIFFGWVAYRVRQFHDQADFIADLRSRGFTVEVEPLERNAWLWEALAGKAAIQVRMAHLLSRDPVSGAHIGPTAADIERIGAWTAIKHLDISFCPAVTDATLADIGRMKQLQSLGLSCTNITNEGLEHLAGLRDLYSLGIHGCPEQCHEIEPGSGITDQGMEELSRLNLVLLHISNYPITDEGLSYICKGVPTLTNLSVCEAKVTDRGVPHLALLRSLGSLSLTGNRGITDDGAVEISKLKMLQVVDLGGTSITREGAGLIADSLLRRNGTTRSWRSILAYKGEYPPEPMEEDPFDKKPVPDNQHRATNNRLDGPT
jgi:hypothetical protein